MNKILLSVVIPSYNEMANLHKGVLDKVEHFLSRKKFSYEVLIVDDGSTDGSIEFVEEFITEYPQFTLIKNPHLGKGGSVTKGVLEAQGTYILFTDMDQATPIGELDKLLPYFDEDLPAARLPDGQGRQGFDIIIGSRNSRRKNAPLTRIVMARAMIFLRTVLVGIQGISDTQCGFKVFKNEVAKRLFKKIGAIHHGFKAIEGSSVSAGFDVEILYLAQRMGYKVKEVPVNWLYVESRRVSPIKDSVDGLLDLIKIKINIVKGVYK